VKKPRLSEVRGIDSATLFKVLSSDTRRGILRMLQRGPMGISALAQGVGVSRSSVTRHIQDLAEEGLVSTDAAPGQQGAQKMCRLRYEHVVVSFECPSAPQLHVAETEMPIGMYSRADVERPCGLASSTGIIGSIDDPQSFLLPERASAQLFWVGRGSVEYVFPNRVPPGAEITRLELAMEICSELAMHRIDCPGDVTVWVNEVELGTWTSFGGFGENRGRLTPPWWWDTRTQYGMLKVWAVDDEGSYVDGSPVSANTLSQLHLHDHAPVNVRIGIKADASNLGCFNLFGRHFGNYEQDMIMRLHYLDRPKESNS
jgi:predicted transcriptional regulator